MSATPCQLPAERRRDCRATAIRQIASEAFEVWIAAEYRRMGRNLSPADIRRLHKAIKAIGTACRNVDDAVTPIARTFTLVADMLLDGYKPSEQDCEMLADAHRTLVVDHSGEQQ